MIQNLANATGQRVFVAACFLLFLGVGIGTFADYGISWDEPCSRDANGLPNYRFLVHRDKQGLQATPEKYHGPAFEIALIFLEKGLGLSDPRDIYLARHLATFLLFFAAVAVFYRMLRERFANRLIGLTGALFLVLSPRIFAEAFYNSKDLAFLSSIIFALATLRRFLQQMGWGSAVLHGLACGFATDIRLMGALVPILTIGLAAGVWLASYRHQPAELVRAGPLLLYLAAFGLFTILFWPILWRSPLANLHNAWLEMSHYPWPGTVLYAGHRIRATGLPWHYIPVWFVITTPLVYLGFFALGAGRLLGDFCRRPLGYLAERPADLGVVLTFVLPLAAIIGLHSVVYNGWRHLYFIYPSFLFVAVLGLVTLYEVTRRLADRFPAATWLFLLIVAMPSLATAVTMIRYHPHQYVYFNRLAGRDLQDVKSRFEIDYWGVSCRKGLEYLLEHDPSPEIRVYAETYPGRIGSFLLPPEQRARIRYCDDPSGAVYWLSHYRYHPEEFPPAMDVFSIEVAGAKIMVVQRIH